MSGVIFESSRILNNCVLLSRFLGKKIGLDCQTEEEQIQADMALYLIEDFYFGNWKVIIIYGGETYKNSLILLDLKPFFDAKESDEEIERKFLENGLQKFLNNMEYLLRGKKFVTGDKVSVSWMKSLWFFKHKF